MSTYEFTIIITEPEIEEVTEEEEIQNAEEELSELISSEIAKDLSQLSAQAKSKKITYFRADLVSVSN